MRSAWGCNIVRILVFVGWISLDGCAAFGQGLEYVEAYNLLAGMLNDRLQAAGRDGDIPLKSPGMDGMPQAVFQDDLNRMRGKVLELMADSYVRMQDFDLARPSRAEAFPCLRASGSPPFFTRVPGEYRDGGESLLADDFSDVPPLWVHIQELYAAMTAMTCTIRAGRWTADSRPNYRSGYTMYGVETMWGPPVVDWGSTIAAAQARYDGEVIVVDCEPRASAMLALWPPMPFVFYPGLFQPMTVVAEGARAESSYLLEGLFTGTVCRVDFYDWVSVNGMAPDPGMRDGQWICWGQSTGGAGGECLSPRLGSCDLPPPWPPYPDANVFPVGDSRGYSVDDAVGVVKWFFRDTPLRNKILEDEEKDGLVVQGCECMECLPGSSMDWNHGAEKRAHIVHFLGETIGTTNAGIRLRHYIREYQVQGVECQRFSLETCVTNQMTGSAEGWGFLTIARPSGANVTFSLCGSRKGEPLGIGHKYRVREAGGDVLLDFPSGVTHRFRSGQLMEVSVVGVSGGRVVIARDGGRWPGLDIYRDAGGHILSNVWAGGYSVPEYNGRLVEAVTHYAIDGERLRRVEVHKGSRILRMLDGGGSITEESRLTQDADSASSEIWEGIRGGDEPSVARKTRRWQEVDPTNGIITQVNQVVYKPDTPSAETNRAEVRLQDFPWGREVVAEVEGAGTVAARESIREYYTNAAVDGCNYGRLAFQRDADGGWSRYSYDSEGRVTCRVTPFQSAGSAASTDACKVEWMWYAGDERLAGMGFPVELDDAAPLDDRPRLVVVLEKGVEVERSWHAYLSDRVIRKRCLTAGARYDAGDSLVSETVVATNGPFAGRVVWSRDPDGVVTVTDYAFQDGTANLVTTEERGTGEDVPTNGLRTITVSDARGRVLERRQQDMDSGFWLNHQVYTRDAAGRVTAVSNLVAGAGSRTVYGCCGPVLETDEDGIQTLRVYDDLKQVCAVERLGVTTFQVHDVNGQVAGVRRQAGSGEMEERSEYDSAGRLVRQIDVRGGVTAYGYATNALGEPVVTTTRPDGSTVVETSYLDGRTRCVTGSAVHAVSYDYGVDDRGRYTVEYRGPDTNTPMWVKTWRDMLGREWRVEYPDGYAVETLYDRAGRITAVRDGWMTQLTEYNGKGEAFRSAVDMDGDGVIGVGGPDRVTDVENGYGVIEGWDARWTRNFVYAVQGSAVRSLAGEVWRSLEGSRVWNIRAGQTNRTEVIRDAVSATRQETVTLADGIRTIRDYTNGLLRQEVRVSGSGEQVSRITYEHDAWGRTVASQSKGPGGEWIRSDIAHDAAGNMIRQTMRAGEVERVTSFAYDEMGRRTNAVLPDGGRIRYGYAPTGELDSQAGSQTVPVRHGYDVLGRLTVLETFRDGEGGVPDRTHWEYDQKRGWMTGKVYSGGATNRFEYRQDGRLVRRVTARGIETRYQYDAGGMMTNMVHSDGTAGVGYVMDRLGRPVQVLDGNGRCGLEYDEAFRLAGETMPGGGSLEYGYDAFGRRTNMVLRGATGAGYEVGYGYDAAGRLSRVQGNGIEAGYEYAADGRSVAAVRLGAGGVEVVSGQREYDELGYLRKIRWQGGVEVLGEREYEVNAIGQRTRCAGGDGTYWAYGYDELGQLIEAGKFTEGGKPVAGQQYKYAYDSIGNRREVQSNGVVMAYTANALNQYESYEAGGGADAGGELSWAGTVFRFGGCGVEVAGKAKGGGVRCCECEYDADGNLVRDGDWRYAWDAESRLIMASNAMTLVQYRYDYRGRRVGKCAYGKAVDNWVLESDTSFVHDGWNLIAETRVQGQKTNVASYVWGLDVSGSVSGAGGIGGLLFRRCEAMSDASADGFFYVYDGNGNVTALVATNGLVVTTYEYDPYGNILSEIQHQPSIRVANSFKFSTRYQDSETALCYYGYRYYNPAMGRWISRDFVGEGGGYNLYGYCANNGISGVDPLGLFLVAFDGTGNNKDAEGDAPTNVRRLWEAYRAKSLYLRGVGSSDVFGWRVIENAGGGYSGAGGQARVEKAWSKIVEHYRNLSDMEVDDDPLDVIGFSRGAALARQFANVVNRRGDPRKYGRVNEWFRGGAMLTSRMNVEGCPLKIRFLGLFDTVPSFGQPGNHIDMGYNLSIPNNVQNVRHAIARDERRELFPLASIAPSPSRIERMFPGVHSDVGGGYAESETQEIQYGPLLWMWQEGRSLDVPWDMPEVLKGWNPSFDSLLGHQSDVSPLKKFLGFIPYGLADHPQATWSPVQSGDRALRPLWIP